MAIGAGTQYTCDLTHLEEVRGKPKSKTGREEERRVFMSSSSRVSGTLEKAVDLLECSLSRTFFT